MRTSVVLSPFVAEATLSRLYSSNPECEEYWRSSKRADHAKLEEIKLCWQRGLLLVPLTRSLHNETEFAGVLSLTAVIQKGLKPLA